MEEVFTVIGCWPESGERFAEALHALSAQDAEEQIYERAGMVYNTSFWTSAVVLGELDSADTYTAFIDPDDPKNAEVEGLFRPFPNLTNDEWTVFGIAWDPNDPRSYREPIGERWRRVILADSAYGAEEAAQAYLKDEGGDLWVCSVIEGNWPRADIYARFANPNL